MPTTITQGSRILFIGDSITDARWREDDQQLLGYGYVRLLAGTLLRRYPRAGLQVVNRGVSGNRVADLRARWEQDAIATSPDIVSVLVGINESHFAFTNDEVVTPEAFTADYRAILTRSRQHDANVQFVLVEPFLTVTDPTFWAWNDDLHPRVAAVRQLAAEFGATVVGANSAFAAAAADPSPAYWAWDGIHPTAAGHQLLAEEWLRSVRVDPQLV